MPAYVNVAKSKGSVGSGDDTKNCACCSAAGAMNLTLGKSTTTSGHVAQTLGKRDWEQTMGSDVRAQAATIADTVSARTGRECLAFGDMFDGELTYDEAMEQMGACPDRTVFALCASGPLIGGGSSRTHWLNAIKVGESIRFFDFQSCRAGRGFFKPVGGGNPSTSTSPFIGIVAQQPHGATNRELHAARQDGSFDTGASTFVIRAFVP